MISDIKHLFISVGHVYVFFGEVSVQVLCPFFKWMTFSDIDFYKFFFKEVLFIFRERGEEGEREGKKHQCVTETPIGYFLYAP